MTNKTNQLWKFWWVAVLLIFAPKMILSRIPDTDTFFLMETGRYIVENRMVPTVNPFVIHEGFGIIVQQWLFDVLVYYAYSALGYWGLFLFVAAAYTVSITLLYRYFGLFTKNEPIKGYLTVACAMLYTLFGVARPTCISFFLMLALLISLEKYRQTGRRKHLAVLPLLSLIQVNFHSAMWPMMFVLMLPYIFPTSLLQKGDFKAHVRGWFQRNKAIFLTLPAMLLAGFLNPNGISGMAYVLKSYGSATGGLEILELKAPTTNSITGILIMLVIVFLTVYVGRAKDKFTDPDYDMHLEYTRITLACGVLVLACMHLRNAWYLFLGVAPLILETIGDYRFNLDKLKRLADAKPKLLASLFLTLTLLLSSAMLISAEFSAAATDDTQYTPVQAADCLDELDKDEITLYTEFNNGAYMEWRGYQVYMDARPELFQEKINGKEDVYSEYCEVENGTIDYDVFLDKYNFTHLIVRDNSIFRVHLDYNPDYTLVVDGEGYALYERLPN